MLLLLLRIPSGKSILSLLCSECLLCWREYEKNSNILPSLSKDGPMTQLKLIRNLFLWAWHLKGNDSLKKELVYITGDILKGSQSIRHDQLLKSRNDKGTAHQLWPQVLSPLSLPYFWSFSKPDSTAFSWNQLDSLFSLDGLFFR